MEKPENLLPIGVVAKSFGVNESSIRRMEEAGILSPAYISKESKYRYYDSDNIARIALILSLKSFGFVNEEIRNHLNHPGDYTELYNILIERQDALNLLISQMKRRLKSSSFDEFEFKDFSAAYCLTKKVKMIPSREGISSIIKQSVFEAVRDKYPIDYSHSVLIVTECMDFRQYRRNCLQDLLFCIPLREKTSEEDIRFFQSRKVVSAAWNSPAKGFESLIPKVDQLFRMQKLKQSDALCASYDVGSFQGDGIASDDTIMHILIPFEYAP
ncbi:MAG: MerR family transcriptional regulator [Clostridia bacterium]|nr:MerR family transcriptional regulator [Clostridia bacterium]